MPRSSASARKWASWSRTVGPPPGRRTPLRKPPAWPHLEQALLGTPQDESQPVQIVQTTAAAQLDSKPFRDKLAPPSNTSWPVRCPPLRQLLHGCPQIRLLRLPKGGGEPPVCSNIKAVGPPSPKADAHPMVCGSRSSASAVAAAVQPCASSKMAYQRSRSLGVGARIIRRRKALAPSAIVSETGPYPSRPSPTPRIFKDRLTRFSPQIYPIPLRISPWLWFRNQASIAAGARLGYRLFRRQPDRRRTLGGHLLPLILSPYFQVNQRLAVLLPLAVTFPLHQVVSPTTLNRRNSTYMFFRNPSSPIQLVNR